MEAIKKRLKATAWFLSILLLAQSCSIYHKTPTTLEKASQELVKTKVTNTNGDIFKYRYIAYENGMFYGVNDKSGELARTPLDQEYIRNVFTKNKKASTWLTVGVIGIPVGFVIVGLILLAVEGVGLEGDWGDS